VQKEIKGLYAQALRGELKSFTGYNDPYEPPLYPEICIDTSTLSVDESIKIITDFLQREAYLKITREDIKSQTEEVAI
jgi:adenylylsulfate kinase-like enzyme